MGQLYRKCAGWRALYANTTANFNAALGPNALAANTGNSNAAFGVNSLFHNTTGIGNIAMGFQAGLNLTTGNNNICIGNFGVAGEGYTTRLGTRQTRAFIAGIRGAVVTGGMPVYVNASGQLGTNPSSRRFKEDIAPMNQQSESILSLQPVTFHYKKDLDPDKVAQFGLVAEEVAKIDPDLVTRNEKGEIYSVRYDAINAMLLNEFLKEHRSAQEQEGKVAALETTVSKQQKQIEALTATVQKVSNQLELSKPVPQVATNR